MTITNSHFNMKKEQILSIIRHTLTFAGGILVTKGLIDEGMATEVVGGLMTLIGTIWGIVDKNN
jgi:hypothetical protein